MTFNILNQENSVVFFNFFYKNKRTNTLLKLDTLKRTDFYLFA